MFLFSALPPIILGIAILVALKLMYSVQRGVGNDVLVMIVTISGWVMIFAGISMLVSPFGMIFVLVIFGMALAKHREGERRALLLTLSLAAEKGIPLAATARGFAARRSDEIARRAWHFADLLDSGLPVSDALKQSGNPLPVDATLMVRLGTDANTRDIALREAANESENADLAWRPVFERTLYLLVVGQAAILVTTFVMIKIIPTFREIFTDFGTTLPPTTQLTIRIADGFAQFWYLLAPFFIYVIGALLVSAFFYAQGKVWIPWPLSWLFGCTENPTILRGLAVCLEQNQPLNQSLQRLAAEYPRSTDARRIHRAATAAAGGQEWCACLEQEQIVTKAEAAVLRTATQAGNLPWALRQIAEVSNRRLKYRAITILNFVSPLCLLGLALPIGLFAIGCMLPLISLIQNLT